MCYNFCRLSHQNGSLLRKYTYLGNDSSYSVSTDDGVDILLAENMSSDDDKTYLDHMQESSVTSDASSDSQGDSNMMQSFTFEAQVGALLITCNFFIFTIIFKGLMVLFS